MKHTGIFINCGLCLAAIAKLEPEQVTKEAINNQAHKHNNARHRQVLEKELRGLGMKKVRGNLGGVYWE